MNRRTLIAAGPTAVLAAPCVVTGFALDGSPLRMLYSRWQAAKDEFNALPSDCDDETENAAFDQVMAIEQVAADFVPRTMEDLAFKIIFADDNGDMSINIHQMALVSLVYRMVGVEPRSRIGVTS